MVKPFEKKTSKQKWKRKFFIAKDGFLLYYAESEMKAFESKHHFNIHPKGVIPLGGCQLTETVDGSQKFAITISHPHFQGEITVGAENEEDCKCWLEALTDAGKVTWKNAHLGLSLVQQLELKCQEDAQEKQEAIDKLNAEASKLEQEEIEEFERLASQLKENKKDIEEAAKILREAKTTTEQELEAAIGAMNKIKEEKSRIYEKAIILQTDLQDISRKTEEAAAQLKERERLAKKLEVERKTLKLSTSRLLRDVVKAEERSKALEQEKVSNELQLHAETEAAQKLKKKIRQISNTALKLQMNLEEAEEAKLWSIFEAEKEKTRRIEIERKLLPFKESLNRLDRAIKESGVDIDLQIESDVKNLRGFLEDCIAEMQFEAHN